MMNFAVVRQEQVLEAKQAQRKPGKPPRSRRELLRIDGRRSRCTLRLNPRARAVIVKVHPTTGEVTVVAPSRARWSGAGFRARRKRLDRAAAGAGARAGAAAPGAAVPFRRRGIHDLAGRERPGPVWRDADGYVGQRPHRTCAAPPTDFLKREAREDARDTRAGICGATGRQAVAHHGARHRQPLGLLLRGRVAVLFLAADFAPDFVRDYVVAHEVAHLKEMNHGPRFWRWCEPCTPRRCAPRKPG